MKLRAEDFSDLTFSEFMQVCSFAAALISKEVSSCNEYIEKYCKEKQNERVDEL